MHRENGSHDFFARFVDFFWCIVGWVRGAISLKRMRKKGDAMHYRDFGRTGWKVSAISFGAWAIGGTWGPVQDEESMAALHAAADAGVNFFDTADVYGDGRSERLLARLRRERPGEQIIVATKAGRRLDPHNADGYNRTNLEAFVERSLRNLECETLDLLQLHCPPTAVYEKDEVYAALDALMRKGKLRYYGVSVEKIDEALAAIRHEQVQSVQIIFNMFRQRPIRDFFGEAQRRKVGVLARLPLSSGMLSGKLARDSRFAADDHRAFNRHGESFDAGETFSGVDYETGLEAVEEIRPLVPAGMSMAQFALRWILMSDAVSCAIPGAKNPKQAQENAAAADLPAIPPATMDALRNIYERRIARAVENRW
jgi:aryl-alcohol dehydrogenase-like predicted oxidoreductase